MACGDKRQAAAICPIAVPMSWYRRRSPETSNFSHYRPPLRRPESNPVPLSRGGRCPVRHRWYERLERDTYVATRTTSGWVSNYTGIHSDETAFNRFAVGDRSLDKFINFKSGCCAAQVPFVFDSNENFLGRWPTNWTDFLTADPGPNEALGAFQPSPDFSHLAFASQTNFDSEGGGLTSAPGSAYDYDVATEETELISKDAHGLDITQDPGARIPPNTSNFPAGTAGSGHSEGNVPQRLDRRLAHPDEHETLQRLHRRAPLHAGGRRDHLRHRGRRPVNYYGMTADGKKVLFTSDQHSPTMTWTPAPTSTCGAKRDSSKKNR